MRILYTSLRPFVPIRLAHGGQRTTHELLTASVVAGIVSAEALCYCEPEYFDRFRPSESALAHLGIVTERIAPTTVAYHGSYTIIITTDRRRHTALLREAVPRADVVLVGQTEANVLINVVKRMTDAPIIWSISTSLGQGNYDLLQIEAAHALDCHFMFCSDHVRFRIEAELERKLSGVVVYPLFDIAQYLAPLHRPRHLTFINPLIAKGSETILKLAQVLPTTQFVIVQGWEQSEMAKSDQDVIDGLGSLENVTYLKRQHDIRPVLSSTRLLLFPSTWEEALGRVVVEAQLNGIPVIASNLGGIPEAHAVGGVLLDDFRNHRRWLEAMSVFSDATEYQTRSNLVRSWFPQSPFTTTAVLEQFQALLSRIT